jgi:hypothetical protein
LRIPAGRNGPVNSAWTLDLESAQFCIENAWVSHHKLYFAVIRRLKAVHSPPSDPRDHLGNLQTILNVPADLLEVRRSDPSIAVKTFRSTATSAIWNIVVLE